MHKRFTIFLGGLCFLFSNPLNGQVFQYSEPAEIRKETIGNGSQTHMNLLTGIEFEKLKTLLPQPGALILKFESKDILLVKTKVNLELQIAAFEAFLRGDVDNLSPIAQGKLHEVYDSERFLYAVLPDNLSAGSSFLIKAFGVCSSDPVECGVDQIIWRGQPERVNINLN